MNVTIYRAGAANTSVKINESTTRDRRVNGEDIVRLKTVTREPLDIELGDTITVEGQQYTLNRVPSVKKVSRHLFEYDMTFESNMYELSKVILLDNHKSEFYLMTDAETLVDLIITNLDRVYPSPNNWTKGVIASTNTRNLQFSNENCLEVLQKVIEEFDLYVDIVGRQIALNDSSGASTGNTFEYGKGKGLYSLVRQNVGSRNMITHLYAYGSDKNLPSNYRNYSKRLMFATPPNHYLQANVDLYGRLEGSEIFDDIYPKRTGTISSAPSTLSFVDTGIDFDLNYYLLPGVPAKVHFNTGNMAGYEFEIVTYDNSTKTVTVKAYEDQNGDTIPASDYGFAAGDEYVFLDITMPNSYVTAAETELMNRANEYLHKNAQPRVKYNLEVDPSYAEMNNILPDPGDYMTVIDGDLQVNREIRIQTVSQQVVNPYAYRVDLSDEVEIPLLTQLHSESRRLRRGIRLDRDRDATDKLIIFQRKRDLEDDVFNDEGFIDNDKIKGRLTSDDGLTYLDLDTGQIQGKVSVRDGSTGYVNLGDKPAALADINSTEGTKLTGVEAGATAGADYSTNVINKPAALADINSAEGTKLTGVEVGATAGADFNTNLANKPVALADINSIEGQKLTGVESGATAGADFNVNLANKPTALGDINSAEGTKLTSVEEGATSSHTFAQTTAPTTNMKAGDFWIDTSDKKKLYRYDGTAWQLSRDEAIEEIQNGSLDNRYISATGDTISGDLYFANDQETEQGIIFYDKGSLGDQEATIKYNSSTNELVFTNHLVNALIIKEDGELYPQEGIDMRTEAMKWNSTIFFSSDTLYDVLTMRRYGKDYTLLNMMSPPQTSWGGARETTLALVRGDSNDYYMDIYNMDYGDVDELNYMNYGNAKMGIRLIGKNEGHLTPFYIEYGDGDTAHDEARAISVYPRNSVPGSPAVNDTLVTIGNDLSIEGDVGSDPETFTGGFSGLGTGWKYNAVEKLLTVDNISVRGRMSVYELMIEQIRASNGSIWVSDAMKYEVDNGSDVTYWRIGIDAEGGSRAHSFAVGDIIKCQKWTGRGIKSTILRVDAIVNDTVNSYVRCPKAEQIGSDPEIGDEFVRIGSTTNSNRRGALYLTASDADNPYMDVVYGLNSTTGALTTKARIGKLDGITDTDAGLDGTQSNYYGIYTVNGHFKGHIHAESGTFRTNNGTSYLNFYDNVMQMYNGGTKLFEVLASTDGGKLGSLDAGSFIYTRGSYISDHIETFYSPVGIKSYRGPYPGSTPANIMWWDETEITIGSAFSGIDVYIYSDFEVYGTSLFKDKVAIQDGATAATQGTLNVAGNSGSWGYAATLYNYGSSSDRYGVKLLCGSTNHDTGWNTYFRFYNSSNNEEGGIRNESGSIGIYNISDRSLKEGIKDVEIKALDILDTVRPKEFNWKSDKKKKKTVGYIAQDAEHVIPKMVAKGLDAGEGDIMGVCTSELIPYLHKAILELKQEINELKGLTSK